MKSLNTFGFVFCFCWMFFGSGVLFAQSFAGIRGTVQDRESGERLRAAVLVVKSGKKEVQRIQLPESGEFVIELTAAGQYEIECSQSGYVSQRITGLQIKQDQIKLAYFNLSPGDSKSEPEEVKLAQ